MTSIPSSPTRLPRRPGASSAGATWKWSAVILVPLILLGVLGVRGIRASRQEAFDEARSTAARVAEYGLRAFERRIASLREGWPRSRLYPLVPLPGETTDAEILYERALAAPPGEAEADFAKILKEHPDSVTSSGLPIAPLIAWMRVKNSDDSHLSARITELVNTAVEQHPSMLTTELLQRTLQIAIERGIDTEDVGEACRAWRDEERLCSVLQNEAARGEERIAHWVNDGSRFIWVEPEETTWRSCAQNHLTEFASGVEVEVINVFAERFALSIRLADRELLVLESKDEPLAQQTSGPIVVTALLANPSVLYQQQRAQSLWLTALLGSALLAVLGGFFAMQRSLNSERALNQQKSDFVSSVSHELRAPIASMRLMLENLESGAVATNEARREYLRLLGGECRRLSTLIENVLDFARIEHDRKVYQFAEADVPAMVRDAIQILSPRAKYRRQQIRLDLHPLDCIPQIDALAIQQALINLVDNAIKFSPEGAEIVVAIASRDKSTWQISVADQGAGIPASEHSRIFERFYRVGSELLRETQGSGIGLSIVKHTIEAHGGRIELESTPGTGSKFTLVLPYTANATSN